MRGSEGCLDYLFVVTDFRKVIRCFEYFCFILSFRVKVYEKRKYIRARNERMREKKIRIFLFNIKIFLHDDVVVCRVQI